MADLDKTKFHLGYLIKGDGAKDYYKAWGTGIRLALTLGLVFCILFTIKQFFPTKKPATSTTSVGKVEAGGVSNITNINNPLQDLKQGIYLRGASDRASVGVFKEVLPHIDVSLGAGKSYEDDAFVEVETRFKF